MRIRQARFSATWLFAAFVALLPLAQPAHATKPPQGNQAYFKSKADSYARTAGLPALSPGSGFEIRLWSYDYIGGGVGGTLVSEGHIRQFSKAAIFQHEKIELGPARMSSPIPILDTQNLKALLARLEPLNGTTVSCPMTDGGSLLIDAVLDRHSIRILADNPWACADKNARAVMQLVYALGDDSATLCLTRKEVTHPTPWVTGFWLSKAKNGARFTYRRLNLSRNKNGVIST